MAKNTRIFYRDDYETFSSLNPEDCQALLLACLSYNVGEQPEAYFQKGDPLLPLFLQMKKKIDNNEKKYQETCKKRTEAANARWHKEDIQPNGDFEIKPISEPIQSPEQEEGNPLPFNALMPKYEPSFHREEEVETTGETREQINERIMREVEQFKTGRVSI